MARIPGVSDSDASLITRGVYSGAKRNAGKVPEPLRLMAHSPAVMWAAGGFELAIPRAKSLPASLRYLVSLKAAARIGCLF